MVVILAIATAMVLYVMAGMSRGWIGASFSACLMAVTLFPFAITGASAADHAGIVDGTPRIYVYTVTLAIGVVMCIGRKSLTRLPKSILLFAFVLLVWFALIWTKTPTISAGLLHFIIAIAAWLVGISSGEAGSRDKYKLERFLAGTVLFIVAMELVIASAQLAGIEVPLYGQGAYAESLFRISGTLGHPGNLGKALFLLLVIVLPLSKSIDYVTRRTGFAAVGLIVVLTCLTLGRANIAATLLAVGMWIVLDRDYRLKVKAWMCTALVAAAAPFASSILYRIQVDPSGGVRPELTTEALRQIATSPLSGTGPNNYVETVGQYGWATAAGLPVHNAFLLAAAELGLIGAILFFLPFAAVVVRGLRTLGKHDRLNPYGRAVLATAPGLLITAFTGWGLLSYSLLSMWVLVYGYAYARSFEVPPPEARLETFGLDSQLTAKRPQLRRTSGVPIQPNKRS